VIPKKKRKNERKKKDKNWREREWERTALLYFLGMNFGNLSIL